VTAAAADVRVLYCDHCRGLLVDRWAFAAVIRSLRSRAVSSPTRPEPIDPAELERNLHCPRCGASMDTHPYYGPGNVVIDTCGACQLLHLDHGELRQIVDAPGRDRGTPW
jgi:Zn-finger nucleic acid-binding protein